MRCCGSSPVPSLSRARGLSGSPKTPVILLKRGRNFPEASLRPRRGWKPARGVSLSLPGGARYLDRHKGPFLRPSEVSDSLKSNWQKHVLASSGYRELGMLDEAANALEEIEPEDKTRKEVLGARVDLYMAAKKWDMAAAVASHLVKMEPEEAGWWINLAYATRRRETIEEAETILLRARELDHRKELPPGLRKRLDSGFMEYSIEEDSSDLGKFVVKVLLSTGDIWFTQVEGRPSHDELVAWVERYQEAASERLKGDPLIVEVVTEGLRSKVKAQID
jgi:tetratricopeptide (TPR) repeat protein